MIFKILLKLHFYLFFILFIGLGLFNKSLYAEVDDNPIMHIHDTIVGPGDLLLQIDALNFTGDNGQISAITLKIDVDTNLIQYIGIQNTTLSGSWLANYNCQENEISIIYTAYFGNGFDIDGKLLDLHIYYYAGFSALLHFKDGCEISNINLQTITNVDYQDGMIAQTTPFGEVSQDSVVVNNGDTISMPVIAEGSDFDSVNQVYFRVGYDTIQLLYVGIEESLLTNIDGNDTNSVVTFNWQDTVGSVNLISSDTLFYMNFAFIGDTNVSTELLPGSKVYNNSILVPSIFSDGKVTAKYWVEIVNNPDTAGVSSGEGYYLEGDSVTVVATPNVGFHFKDWILNDSVVSTDSIYIFLKQYGNDTLFAVFDPNLYSLLLLADPADGGIVLGAGNYLYGDSVTATATPNEGYDFVAWLFGDDTVSFDSVYSFVMPNNNMGLTANFQLQSFVISSLPNNPDFGMTTGGGAFNYGDTATLVATPFDYYNFIVWTENGQAVSYDSIYSFLVNANRDLIANFQYDANCSAPVGLYVDSLSDSTAMLHWLPSGDEEEWDLIWGETEFDTIDEGVLVEGLSETYYYLTNLDAGTVYDFYVRAVCTDEIHSVWEGPYTFTTWYVSVKENILSKSAVVYPNPANDVLTVYLKGNTSTIFSYRIINTFGQIEMKNRVGVNKFNINLSKLPQGVYFIQLYIESGMITRVFLKR